MGGRVVGSFSAEALAYMSTILAVGTIATCYLLSCLLGYTPWWLSDITHTAIKGPSRFVFRIGMLPACCGMMLLWWLAMSILSTVSVFSRSSRPRLIRTLGIVASGALIVSSSVLEAEDTQWTLHVICATSFFLLTFVAQTMTTFAYRTARRADPKCISSGSLLAKCAITTVSFSLLLLDGILALAHAPSVWSNLIEWLLTFTVVCYNLTFAADFRDRAFVACDFAEQPSAVAPSTRGVAHLLLQQEQPRVCAPTINGTPYRDQMMLVL